MLNLDETLLLNQVREKFYALDWKYGEVFDSNLVDCIACDDLTFQECVSIAREDTESYIFLESSVPTGTTSKPRHFDA